LGGSSLAAGGRWCVAGEEAQGKDESAGRLDRMRAIATSITLKERVGDGGERVVAVRPDPLLRYDDPPRHMHDASLWTWGNLGRPVAVLKVELYPPHPPERRWVLSLVALSANRITTQFHDGERWESTKPGVDLTAFPEAAPPAASDTLRLAQMKALARQFSASENPGFARGRLQLRLMPKPFDRYADVASGLRDGVLFGFATGTNPDIFLLIEAWEKPGAAPAWHYGLARNGGGRFTVSLDGNEVWSQQSLANPPVQLETYMNRRIAEGNEPC
jgi:hypothetical protein